MIKSKDSIIGQKFNRLTIVDIVEPEIGSNGNKIKKVKCVCDCGNIVVTRYSSVKSGHTKGCGKKHRSYMDMTGCVFGKLTVVEQGPDEILDSKGKRHIRWYCKCECGNLSLCRGSSLRYGSIKSCGCSYKEINKNQGLIDLTGLTFGRWFVLHRSDDIFEPSGKKIPVWLCQCECGEFRDVRGSSLRNGDSLSCGCYKYDVLKDKYLDGKIVSQLELDTASFLDFLNLNYESQHIFPDLRGESGYPLSFDYIVYFGENDFCLIECQGRQHYEPIEYFGGIDRYNKQIENDNKKRIYANKKGIKLIELPYTENSYDKVYKYLGQFINEKGLI